jgi:Putative MetA-pathway of phenol degradation
MKNIIFSVLFVFITFSQLRSQCACCAGAGSSNSDFTYGTQSFDKGQWLFEANADFRSLKHHHMDHHDHGDTTEEIETLLSSMTMGTFGIRYGITDRISASATLPYVFLTTENGNDNGLGDLILLGTYNFYAKNNFTMALQLGVELPTGVQKDAKFDNTTVVVGSGSVDPMIGFQFSNHWRKLNILGNGIYKRTTEGFEKTNYGSLSIQNLSLAYQLKGENSFCTPNNSESIEKLQFGWTVFGGYYGEWLDQIKEEGVEDENSGHYLGFATLGTKISIQNWSFPLTVSLPIIKQVNGNQNDPAFRLRLGINKVF